MQQIHGPKADEKKKIKREEKIEEKSQTLLKRIWKSILIWAAYIFSQAVFQWTQMRPRDLEEPPARRRQLVGRIRICAAISGAISAAGSIWLRGCLGCKWLKWSILDYQEYICSILE